MTRLHSGRIEYRLEAAGDSTVLVLHGGHMRAGLAPGEETYLDRGYSVLVPSRPGYGRTPLSVGPSPSGFADVLAELCRELGIDSVAAVVGISAGGRTALAMASRCPRLVQRLVLESSVGFGTYPDRRTRIAANIVFNARTERLTWGAVRALLRLAPTTGLRLLLGDLSTKPAHEVVAALGDEERARMVELFSRMRSGSGFLNDIDHTRAVAPETVTQPTLVVASRTDGGVPFAHAESLTAGIPGAELFLSGADSHLGWFGDRTATANRIERFLAADPRG
ncbi:pimeloyl-ACP methyl ester carboxylesterase [Saccharopolyspora lacisalsi]|uniref:Pimeloyl-ACP methyl ester carboxylesterase n=1 Tax=Halosaccharopolyspora lacisalsi TaxID=1000566 RepID=A0A839DZG7_9PSEU|nr:alpha/beta hydrolase [Halosaccharopolyspora lacisalsi]MBA8827332.1 pimeloyl-ACP methyl ester carboxylesterase [Halosaccharopolyspora lacisalsi]